MRVLRFVSWIQYLRDTAMDWPETNCPTDKVFGPNKVQLKEKSLLPVIQQEPQSGWDTVFTCHDFNDVSMYYR